ncbi:MAG: META domain-containing protein [Crocinitomicaceae bacterium]|jgi:hypothetical protein|nr:META domain-containing protein [Crocinitomicaceae bacterium]MBK6950581.1 META domain-containing protein [Crocinitomicaceae bacterium]
MRIGIIFFIGLITLCGCRKDSDKSECIIDYKIDSSTSYSLTSTRWKLIGFKETSKTKIDYPPCEGYRVEIDGKVNADYGVYISFQDTMHNYNNPEMYPYPYIYGGNTSVNSYAGSYEFDYANNLALGIFNTTELCHQSSEIMDFERRYYRTLKKVDRFEINHNVLTVYYNSTDKMIFVPVE